MVKRPSPTYSIYIIELSRACTKEACGMLAHVIWRVFERCFRRCSRGAANQEV